MDKLSVMDNVSGLADKSNDFGSFLTVCKKFECSCIYIFHTIYPEKSDWQMVISQMKIFNIFLGSIQLNTVLKIISSNFYRQIFSFILINDLWLYMEFSSKNNKTYLPNDCRNVNSIGPVKVRANAENPEKQFFYFNEKKKNKSFNTFLSTTVESQQLEIVFKLIA